MIKFMSCMGCKNSISYNRDWRKPFPMTCNKVPFSRIRATKLSSSTTKNVFKWANSQDEDSSTSAASLSLTSNFIIPVERRPNLTQVSKSDKHVPIIDLGRGDNVPDMVEEIARACDEFGLFLVMNHGITQSLCENMLSAATDLFHLPPQVKALLVSDDPTKDVRITNHYRKVGDEDNQKAQKFSMWSEVFKHPWHPTDDNFATLLPSKPPEYRRLVTAYSKEMGILMRRLLSLMSLGLGLEGDYLYKRLGKEPLCRVQANYYPPCSNPDLTLGLGVHTDRDALTVVLPSPNVEGLQIMYDNKWIPVDPLPNALVVNIGDQLQVLSNGKYKSVVHRVVTNARHSRTSLAMFYGPDKDAMIGPIEDLVDEQHPPVYRNYYFREFLEEYRKQEGKNRKIKEFFEIQRSDYLSA